MPQRVSRGRAWGTRFDPLPSSPPPGSPVPQNCVPATDSSVKPTVISSPFPNYIRREDKMPHDASVFVGSLPTNMDQQRLGNLLSDHLSEHAQVRNIKIVRDTKGGICAFVQCPDADAASNLLQTLHTSTPKPFLGRFLRYEPARAFRTLLVSYRKPSQLELPGDHDQGNQSQAVELDLPYAMRVCRPKHSKFYTLLYNNEAVDIENRACSTGDQLGFEEESIFLQPLNFDKETIYSIATHFGPLERLDDYEAVSEANPNDFSEAEMKSPDEKSCPYPAPHDSPRSDNMDRGCFIIKWAHRDDAVTALMTLRRVPHLTVTWAHQPSHGFDHRTSSGASYPLHVQQLPRKDQGTHQQQQHPSISELAVLPAQTGLVRKDPVHRKGDESIDSSRDLSATLSGEELEWTDRDFPPLGESKGARVLNSNVWNKRVGKHTDPESDDSRQADAQEQDAAAADLHFQDTPTLLNPHDDDRTPQEFDSSKTPSLRMSPVTPKTPNSQFPITPASSFDNVSPGPGVAWENSTEQGSLSPMEEHHQLDPTTLFIGGLEMYGPGAWDEEKINAVFSVYGGLQWIRLVKPSNARAAFAFVKFDNEKAPAAAILEQHNRLYDGRAIRVQLRDCNPPRKSWKLRGKGRHSHPSRPVSEIVNYDRYRFSEAEGIPFDDHSVLDVDNTHLPPPSYDLATPYLVFGVQELEQQSRLAAEDQSLPGDGILHEPATTVSLPSHPSSPHSQVMSSQAVDNSPLNVNQSHTPDLEGRSSDNTTPPSSSLGSSVSVPSSASGMGYAAPNGFYPFPPWMPHYPLPPVPHQVPYYGNYQPFPPVNYPAPQPPPNVSPPSSDASGSANPPSQAISVWTPPGTFNVFVPYLAGSQRAAAPAETRPSASQGPPLQPTGFIQNEQGTLIPVYQPEALDQYMAAASPPSRPIPQPQQSSSPAPSQHQPTQTTAVPAWPRYPTFLPPVVPYIYPPSLPVVRPPLRSSAPFPSPSETTNWTVPAPMFFPPGGSSQPPHGRVLESNGPGRRQPPRGGAFALRERQQHGLNRGAKIGNSQYGFPPSHALDGRPRQNYNGFAG